MKRMILSAVLLGGLMGNARAITFDQWAAGRWPDDIAPPSVWAHNASIHSLAGIGNYDWTTSPTMNLGLSFN